MYESNSYLQLCDVALGCAFYYVSLNHSLVCNLYKFRPKSREKHGQILWNGKHCVLVVKVIASHGRYPINFTAWPGSSYEYINRNTQSKSGYLVHSSMKKIRGLVSASFSMMYLAYNEKLQFFWELQTCRYILVNGSL